MISKSVLTPEDLAALLEGIWTYNSRGQVLAVAWFAADGTPLELGWCEVVSETPGLRLRTAPEPGPESQVSLERQLYPPVAEAYQQPQPASMEALKALMESQGG